MDTHKVLVTSALPYVNNVPHLGNIVGAVLSADVFARFCRSYGYQTLFVCGTDEHGTATETKAMQEGMTPQEICDKYYQVQKEIYDWFNITFDTFGRTSTPEQTELTHEIFNKLYEKGYISQERVEQLYCENCQQYLADRFVEGTCPHCGYEDARGDQCDHCGRVLNPPELVRPVCKMCGGQPVVRESEHLFIDLPALKPKLLEWMDATSSQWPANARTIAYAWIEEGLKKRAITRDLNWGVPVPLEGFENKVFYVWFDAPIGYLSITKRAFPGEWEDWWKDPENVTLYQFMGKDNIPFHTILFPSSLLGTGDTYTMLDYISSTEYLNYEDTKFSKSRQIGVFGDDLPQTGISSDLFRYYLLRNRPEKSDSQFKWEDFKEKVNNELVANLGNLVNRTITFINKYFEAVVPEPEMGSAESEFLQKVKEEESRVTSLLEQCELKEALEVIMQVSRMGNQFFQEREPWKMIKEDKASAGTTIYVLAQLVKDLGVLIHPYLPDSAERMFSLLAIDERDWSDLGNLSVEAGTVVSKPEILFPKFEQSQVLELRRRFSGKEELPLQLIVGRIEHVEDHPQAEHLLVLSVTLGEEKRQLVAGLKGHYTEQQLTGRHIVVVANLKPAKLRGVQSQGMLLAAQEGDTVSIIDASGCTVGDQLLPAGFVASETQIDAKAFSQVPIAIRDQVLAYNEKPLKTQDGVTVGAQVSDGAQVR